MRSKVPTTLGLRNNWKQFSILVLVNAFVGGMVGLERTIIPAFAEQSFGISSKTAILSFIIAFGITKAIANYYAGKVANNIGRKKLLSIGWLLAIPIPLLLLYAPNWNWVLFANVLLGVSQGLTWSSTVVMKIDLVGEKDRGFAMGINEFAGYISVGIVAFVTGYIAESVGITPYPFYLGLGIALMGTLISILWVKDTRTFVHKEQSTTQQETLSHVFTETTFTNKTLSAVTQAGLVNNLNDGMMWGLLPIFLASLAFTTETIGIVAAVYPMVWGLGQLVTGKMSDHYSKKKMLFWGMFLQGIAILLLAFSSHLTEFITMAILLGLGTALVYPTFLSTIAAATSPLQRAESIGVFRLWRDLGYAVGAIISGITADILGTTYAIVFIGCITLLSAVVIKVRMPNSPNL